MVLPPCTLGAVVLCKRTLRTPDACIMLGCAQETSLAALRQQNRELHHAHAVIVVCWAA
jgi:hypothetical protein